MKFFEKISNSRERFSGLREILIENDVKLRVEGNEEEAEIKITRGDEEIINLKTFAAEGTKLELNPKGKWEADPERKIIRIGKYKDIDCLLGFLHEAGHLDSEAETKLALAAKEAHSREKMKDKGYSYPRSRLRAMNEERKAVIRLERSAWAFALKKTRQIEKQLGIKILQKMGTAEDLAKYVNGFLDSYENGYLDELDNINIYTKEQMEKLFTDIEKKPE